MKEMVYTTKRKIELLDTGYCLGLLYYIISLGTHPVAYIKIPKDHDWYKKEYENIDIDVHGGLTYSNSYLYISEKHKIKGWFIGWDYAHYGDYLGYDKLFNIINSGKKWTTEEIFKDVKSVCYQVRYEETKDKLEKEKITHNQAREIMELPKIEKEGKNNESI